MTEKTTNHICPHVNPMLLVLERDAAEDVMDILVMDLTAPSHKMTEVDPDALPEQDPAVFMVTQENLTDLIKPNYMASFIL